MKQSSSLRWSLIAVLGLVHTGCTVGQIGDIAGDDEEDAFSIAAPLSDAWGPNPCDVLKPTVKGLVGTDGNDVIFGTNGDDEIWGNGGDDIICAGDGDDIVHAGSGDDYVDGGDGNDELDGGDDDDLIHGRGGSDVIHGGDGNDELFGDILDDKIFGDAGNDLLIGGHGADRLDGGDDDDYMRGDTNEDEFHGGNGKDTASFATAMPPGQPQGTEGSPNPIDGVAIDFAARTASGDGFEEPLDDVERVIGSPFNDAFANVGSHTVIPDYGNDTCDGASCGGKGSAPSDNVLIYMTPETRDLGIVILGTAKNDHLAIEAVGKAVRIRETHGAKLSAADGCVVASGDQTIVKCEIGDRALRFILGWGGAGDDEMRVSGALPRDITVHIDGGEGNDTIEGGDEEDVFFTGRTGSDDLRGNGGDDALISESYAWHKDLPGAAYAAAGGGGDLLSGGPGDDQIVVDYPCGGHRFIGGSGHDIAGFARSGSRPLTAQLAGPVKEESTKQPFFGRAFNDLCASDWQTYATHMDDDLEVLEGSEGDDVLHGADGDDTIWARGGDDKVFGHGGNDVLRGLGGNDTLYGGRGRDFISGGDGYDWIYANDGEADLVLNCNEGGGELVTSDKHDPAPQSCGGNPPGGGSSGGSSGGGGGSKCGGDDFSLPSGGEGHCYRVITPRTWDQARQQCQDVGMHLATLTPTESQEASKHIGTATWIGGHRDGATKSFYWVVQSESFPGNAPWYSPAEANDAGGDRCVAVLQDGTWGLRQCDDVVPALCEG
jgi:Ca2+-binding RTX toxin-like protein